MKLESEIYHLETKLSDKVTELMNLKVAARQRQEGRRATQIAQGVFLELREEYETAS
jgi:hypothetical protein